LLERLKSVCRDTIATAPGLGTRCDELLPGMRCFSVGNYVIFFRNRDPVEILRIINGKRDFSNLIFED
jgi:plasmid stabilization system protein ParE